MPLPPAIANHPDARAYKAAIENPVTLGALFEDFTRRHAGRQALAYQGTATSYAQLRTQARAVAKALIAAGITKGMRIAVLFTNRPEFISAAYGVAMAGGVLAPVHSVSSPRERNFMLMHSDSAMLLMQPSFQRYHYLDELVAAHLGIATAQPGRIQVETLPYLRRIVSLEPAPQYGGVQSWSEFLAAGEAISDAMLDAVAAQVHPADDAIIIYTSGSTGDPKGVLHRHRAACTQQSRTRNLYGLDESDRVWSVNPLFWSAGFAFFMGVLTFGACMVLQERMEPAETLELIERERVTTLASWPATLAPLADHPDAARRDLSSLVHVPTQAALRRHLDLKEKAWGPTVSWGLSEAFATSTFIIAGDGAEPLTVPGGYPMPGMDIRIIDLESGSELPAGQTGEIIVRGPQLMRGYIKRLPEEAFDAEGFIHTRDTGFIDPHGRLHFTGRLSNMIKASGANVSAMEVENVLARWGRVKSAYVTGIPDERTGEAVVACVVQRDDMSATEAEIIAHLKGELASYKVPRHILFLKPEEVPLTSSNKVQLPKLRELAIERLQKSGSGGSASA